MKKVILSSLILIAGAMTVLSFSKKDAPVIKPGSPVTKQVLLNTAVKMNAEDPTGTIMIPPDMMDMTGQPDMLFSGEVEGQHSYRLIGPIDHTNPPYDPCAQDWINFNNWYNAHYPAWKAWADAHCQRVGFAWSGKCIACIIGFIEPDWRRCGVIQVSNPAPAFE